MITTTMKSPTHLSRFPFPPEGGVGRYCVAGVMVNEPDDDFNWSVDSPSGKVAPTFCVDCSGDLGPADLVYGKGAIKCMKCGSIFQVLAG